MSTLAQSQLIWNRIVSPGTADMPPAAARYILSLRIPLADIKRYKRLSSVDPCDLDLAKREDLESLVQANTALMLLQAKARVSLQPRRRTA